MDQEQKDFLATYGFLLYWPKGGYYSDNWIKFINYFKDKVPKDVKAVDYVVEGEKITKEGIDLILTEGFNKPNLAVCAKMLSFFGAMSSDINKTAQYIVETAKNAPKEIEDAVKTVYDTLMNLYNATVLDIENRKAWSLEAGMPTVSEVFGGSQMMNVGGYPAYTLMPSSVFTDFIKAYDLSRTAEVDVRESVSTNTMQGVVADAYRYNTGATKSGGKGVFFLAGGAMIAFVGGILLLSAYAPKPKGD